MNVDADVLSLILREMHDQNVEADTVCALFLCAVLQDTTLIEAYSCNIQVTETLDMQKDPKKSMLLEDWIMSTS